MIDKYEIRENSDGNHELRNENGSAVYEWTDHDGYKWPDPDAVNAAIEDAEIGNPQKALFQTLFTGPDTPDQE